MENDKVLATSSRNGHVFEPTLPTQCSPFQEYPDLQAHL